MAEGRSGRLPDALWPTAAILCQSLAVVLAKMAAIHTGTDGFVLAAVFNPWFLITLASLGLVSIFWTRALISYPVSYIYPFMSLTFLINLFSAWWLFNESVQLKHVLGAGLIVAGVVIIARSRVE